MGLPIHVVYGSDFSVRGYHDREFAADFGWDVDLLGGYSNEVLMPKAADREAVTSAGLAEALLRLQPAVVLVLGYHHPLDRAALRLAPHLGACLWFRGEVNEVSRMATRKGAIFEWLRAMRLRALYRRCSACLPIGQRAREHYLKHGVDQHRLHFSPYAVDDSAFRASEGDRALLRADFRSVAGVAPGDVVVAFSGKFSRRKGAQLLPAALQALARRMGRRVCLLGIGDGELRQWLQAQCQAMGLGCHLTGFVNQRAISGWYHAADVLCLPSLYGETWGLVVNDALHHGLAAVVSDKVGCAPDLVLPGQTGEVAMADDEAALADALLSALSWSEREGENGRQRCRRHVGSYDIEAAAAGLASAWRDQRGAIS